MSKVQLLRALVNQRLTAAAEEIFGLFERTIAEYEEEIDRQSKLLQGAAKPDVHKHEAVFPANVKTFTVIKEVPPEQQPQQRNPSLDQDPKLRLIKEEQEELWSSQDGEQEDDEEEEKPQSSQLHQRQTEENRGHGEDCGGPEPAGNCNPTLAQPACNNMSHPSETGVGHESGLTAFRNNDVPVSDVECKVAQTYFSCCDCAKVFISQDLLQIHMKCHTGEKTFTCPFCGKKFTKSSNLTTHLRVHTGEKPFTCSVCNTSFSLRCTLVNHMRVHTGEKPFSCSVCGKRFSKKANLTTHMALHTEEKPFQCSVCAKRFTWHSQLRNHKCVDGSR